MNDDDEIMLVSMEQARTGNVQLPHSKAIHNLIPPGLFLAL